MHFFLEWGNGETRIYCMISGGKALKGLEVTEETLRDMIAKSGATSIQPY